MTWEKLSGNRIFHEGVYPTLDAAIEAVEAERQSTATCIDIRKSGVYITDIGKKSGKRVDVACLLQVDKELLRQMKQYSLWCEAHHMKYPKYWGSDWEENVASEWYHDPDYTW